MTIVHHLQECLYIVHTDKVNGMIDEYVILVNTNEH